MTFWKRGALNYLTKESPRLKPANSLIKTLVCIVYILEKNT